MCVTDDRSLVRLLRRTLGPLDRSVSFVPSAQALEADVLEEPALVIADVETARAEALQDVMSAKRWRARVLAIARWEEQAEALSVLDVCQCDHLIARSDSLDEAELLVTALKLLDERDIFGLEKYLAWGVQVRQRPIASYDDKRQSIEDVAAFAGEVGCRRRMIGRIEIVLDELLMNALYDAPAAPTGDRSTFLARATPGAGPVSEQAVDLRFGCDGRFLAISVRDQFGALGRQTILSHLSRAVTLSGAPLDSRHQGAGLGLYFVLSSVSRFIVNVRPGETTEVICLFDLRRAGRFSQPMASSFHIFTSRETRPEPAAAT